MKNIEWLKLWAEGHALEYMEHDCKRESWKPMQMAEECVAVPGPGFSDRFVFRKAQPKQYLYVLKKETCYSGNTVMGFVISTPPEMVKKNHQLDGISNFEDDYLIFGQEVRT